MRLWRLSETELLVVLKSLNKPRLEAMLGTVEARLGTVLERPRDLEIAQAIAHRLNNLLVAERLRESLEDK